MLHGSKTWLMKKETRWHSVGWGWDEND